MSEEGDSEEQESSLVSPLHSVISYNKAPGKRKDCYTAVAFALLLTHPGLLLKSQPSPSLLQCMRAITRTLVRLQKAFEERETKALVSSQLLLAMMDWNIAHAEGSLAFQRGLSIESDTQTNPLKPTLH